MNSPSVGLGSVLAPESDALRGLVEKPRLRGDLGVWLVILLELLTFAILFVSFAFARTREVALFNASQATLNLNTGALNTALLITGSWCVASAVRAVQRNASALARVGWSVLWCAGRGL